MNLDLRILHLEDTEADGELIIATLESQGIACDVLRVDTRDAFVAALDEGGMDIILSDFSLPTFDGIAGLKLAQEKRPEVPFIFVSGTLGEEIAIDALQCGASDYVFKHRLPRLAPAIRRAIADAEKRQELLRAEMAMIQSEYKYRQLFDCLGEAALLADAQSGRILDTNRQAESLLGRTRAEILGTNIEQLLMPATLAEYRERLVGSEISPERVLFDGQIRSMEGSTIPVAVSATPIVIYERRLILALYRDITERLRTAAEIQDLKAQLSRYPKGENEPSNP
jgi:PAS domain S-box-containing protein